MRTAATADLSAITATLDGASGDGHIAVLVPLLALYDADQRAYRISTPTETRFFGDIVFEGGFMRYPHDFLFVPVASSSKGTGSYIGANAFGVMTTVQATHNEDYGVALVDQKRNGDGWNRQRGDLMIPMSPDRAATLKEKLGVMIIGDLVPPGTIEGSLHAGPTLSAPTDLTVRQRYVTMTSPCAAIVTTDTREVLRLLTR